MKNQRNKKEVWKSVGWFNDYQISNLGNVKSLKYNKERILNPSINTKGYYQVVFTDKSRCKIYRVHRLVATYFIKNKHNYLQVNHIDGNKLNNNVSNLEWCSARQNMLHAHRLNLRKYKNKTSKFRGVFRVLATKPWRSTIKIGGKTKYIGSYSTEEEANIAYKTFNKEATK